MVATISFGQSPAAVTASKKSKRNPETPNIRMTKQGNPYFHTNTAKKVCAGLGVLGAAATAITVAVMTRNPKAALLILPHAIGSIAGGLVSGALIDGYANHNEKRKADQMAAFNKIA